MNHRFIFALVIVIAMQAAVLAQEKPAEGSMTLVKKTWQLSQGVAYESAVGDEDRIVVVLSNQPVTAQKLKQALQERKWNRRSTDE